MMPKETLIIKHFGPIHNVELKDIKQFLFLVGESGSGKSTILKVLAMMRHIYKQLNLRAYLKLGNVIDKSIDLSISDYLRNGGMTDYVTEQTVLIYIQRDCELFYTPQSGLRDTRKTIAASQLSLEKFHFFQTNVVQSQTCWQTMTTDSGWDSTFWKLSRISRKLSNV